MRISFWTIAVALACVLGSADQAFAWGPGTHIGLAASILERLPLLPTTVAAVLARHGIAFLYGNIAADIVFAKRWSRVKQACHHWSTAFGLLDSAKDDRSRAFGYGYLSHLAADSVAHGKYVPRQIILSQCSANFGHLFWELRVDALETEATWRLLEQVVSHDHADHHKALEARITGTLLPYDVNRLVFDRVNLLAMRRGFRRTVDVWNRCSRWYLSPELVSAFRIESLERIHSILADGSRSALVREDPNGTSALMHLRVHRREVRRLKRRGLPVRRRIREATHGLAPRTVCRGVVGESPNASPVQTEDAASGEVVLQD